MVRLQEVSKNFVARRPRVFVIMVKAAVLTRNEVCSLTLTVSKVHLCFKMFLGKGTVVSAMIDVEQSLKF